MQVGIKRSARRFPFTRSEEVTLCFLTFDLDISVREIAQVELLFYYFETVIVWILGIQAIFLI